MRTTRTIHRHSSDRGRRRTGIGMPEVLISMLLVSGLLVSALNTLGSANLGRQSTGDHARGDHLAQELMSEILAQSYEDPGVAILFGPELGESPFVRADYDDVDDYHGWNSTSIQRRDGTTIAGFDGWTRQVSVEWADPNNLANTALLPSNIKRITVTVRRNDKVMAALTAIRTPGPPAPAANPVCLMVVRDTATPNAQEQSRITQLESWGYAVNLIQDGDSAVNYTAALVEADVAYVTSEASAAAVGSKLTSATIGVVSESPGLVPSLGFGPGFESTTKAYTDVQVNSHAITAGFPLGDLTLFTSSQPQYTLSLLIAPGAMPLTYTPLNGPSARIGLGYLETGSAIYPLGVAAGRRVKLPWGDAGFDFNSLNDNGKTILQRSLEWARGSALSPLPLLE